MADRESRRGSVSLEAAMTFPFVLLALLALFMIVRFFLVFEVTQHAMYETGREMSSYYYLYAASSLERTHNGVSEVGGEARSELNEFLGPFERMQKDTQTIADSFQGAATGGGAELEQLMDGLPAQLDALSDDMEQAAAQIERAADNPVQMVKYIAQAAGAEGAQQGVNLAMMAICRQLIKKHIPGGDLDAFAKAFGLEDFKASCEWNRGGSGEIELMSRYVFRVPLFSGLELPVTQRIAIKGWGLGV